MYQFAECHQDLIKLSLKTRVEGPVHGTGGTEVTWMLCVQDFILPCRKLGEVVCMSCTLNIVFSFVTKCQGAAIIHPGSDKHMIPCGLILWEEGWNFLWVEMPQEKGSFFKPGVSSWLSQVSDK